MLSRIGNRVRQISREIGGVCCRRAADTFFIYCPHQEDYDKLLKEFLYDTFDEEELAAKVTLRFGVFAFASYEANVEERFVCARIAADRVKDDPSQICGFYDLG